MRARNLKPGFFQNEQLAEITIPARLLFAGLWCMADREGRLEDRPKRIKMQIYPADMLDVEPLLQSLAEQRLIVRYSVNGVEYIWIPKFSEHQNPHPHEKSSVIPPCPGAEKFHDKPKAVTCNDMQLHDTASRAESLFSESLNPESPLPPKGERDRFPDFWQTYPKKIGKAAAKRVWSRKGLNAKADEVLAHLATRVRSDAQWLEEGGRFIPNPATWLNRDGWEDVYAVVSDKRHYL